MKLAYKWMVLTLAAVGLCACGGGGNQETSVLLLVKNGTGIARPDQVQIDVYDSENGAPQTLGRTVAVGADEHLGDLVIYPVQGTLTLRVAVFGKVAGVVISSGRVDVAVQADKQVKAEAVLMPGLPVGDGGLLPLDGGQLPIDGGQVDAPDSSTDGATGDTQTPGKKTQGEACGQPSDCISGFCWQEVCCDQACDGSCRTCKAPGQPAGQCTPAADGSKCGESMCAGAARRTLFTNTCVAGQCEEQQQSCGMAGCNRETLTCN